MFERTKNKWKVTLQSQGGPTKDVEVEAYWSTTWEGIKDEIGKAAAIQEWLKSNKSAQKRVNYVPISVELVTV